MNWQPISTAPKDGTQILAYGKRNGRDYYDVTWWRQPSDDRGYTGWGEFNKQYWPPTHWIPLEPPK